MGDMTMLNIRVHTLAARLRASRRAADIDQHVMASRLGVNRNTVSNWERGLSEPNVSQFLAWAEITGQPVEQLIDGLEGAQNAPVTGESDTGRSYTPRDLNPEPTDYESDDLAFWEIVADVALPALAD